MNKVFKIGAILSVFTLNAGAQSRSNSNFERLKNEDHWYDFAKLDREINYKDLFTKEKSNFGMGLKDEFRIVSNEVDNAELNTFAIRFKQYYDGLEVDNGDFIVHTQGEIVNKANGKFIKALNFDRNQIISEKSALNTALESINSKEYKWQNKEHEAKLKEAREDLNATYFPKGELKIGRKIGTEFTTENYSIIWSFRIYSSIPEKLMEIHINAKNGKVIDAFDPSHSALCRTGTVQTMYNGTRSFNTTTCLLCANYSLNDCRGANGNSGINTTLNGNILKDADNVWTSVAERPATTAHWITQVSWDYFKNTFGRNGFDNAGNTMYVNAGVSGLNNAYFDGNNGLVIGYAANGNSYTALDVMGHEFTHAVTKYSSALIYEKESGALNESFSDIFGTVIESQITGSLNWTLGEDANTLRDMSNPQLFSQPSTYSGANWVSTIGCVPSNTNDQCGVHTNSGVQNKWFYLLSTGGNFNGVTVQSIGLNSATAIAYKNLTQNLISTSDYAAARVGSINAAISIFGVCSNEVKQVKNAWAAVGVGAPDNNALCIASSSFPSPLCKEDRNLSPVAFSVSAGAGSTFAWTIPVGWTATINGNTATVTNFANTIAKTISVVVSYNGQSQTVSKLISWKICNPNPCPGCPVRVMNSNTNASLEDIKMNESLNTINFNPNPANSEVTFENLSDDIGNTISIYSQWGQKVKSIEVNALLQKVEISDLQNGIYLLVIESNKNRRAGRLIVNR
jgi:Zn-dependent metalloprotease